MTPAEAKTGIAGMTDADKYDVLKWMIEGMSDAQQIAFAIQYNEDTSKEIQFIDAPDTVTLIQKTKKVQPAHGPGS